MLVQVPICSHDKVDLNVCVIGGDEEIKKELAF